MFTKDQINEVSREIGNILRSTQMFSPTTVSKSITMAAYMLYKSSRLNTVPTYDDFKNHTIITSRSTVSAIRLLVNKESWNKLISLLHKYSPDLFRLVVLDNAADEFSTPESLIKLASKLLNISPFDRVIDIGCGTGTFLSSIAMSMPTATFYGCELELVASEIARIRAEVIAEDYPRISFTIDSFDAFVLGLERNDFTFTKVFSNYPFGMMASSGSGAGYLEYITGKAPEIRRVRSADWLYNYLAIEMLADDGKAVVVMPDGGLFNNLDKDIRKYFIEKGWIEAVIKLPERLFAYTGIGTNLVILSKGNKTIRFVNASHIYQQERRIRTFSEDDVDEIVQMSREDSDYSTVVSNADVLKNDAILLPTDYLKVSDVLMEKLPHVPMSTVTEAVLRGAPMNAKELDSLISQDETDYQFLNLSNIHDGRVDNELPYLVEISEKNRKYCLQNDDLILSKNSAPFKVAVAKTSGKQIVANGNLYVLRIDKEKILPYYLQAYFQSNSGQRALDSISNGTVLKSISVDALRKLEIPVPEMAVQKKIAEALERKVQELALLEKKINRVRRQLGGMFEEMMEEALVGDNAYMIAEERIAEDIASKSCTVAQTEGVD